MLVKQSGYFSQLNIMKNGYKGPDRLESSILKITGKISVVIYSLENSRIFVKITAKINRLLSENSKL